MVSSRSVDQEAATTNDVSFCDLRKFAYALSNANLSRQGAASLMLFPANECFQPLCPGSVSGSTHDACTRSLGIEVLRLHLFSMSSPRRSDTVKPVITSASDVARPRFGTIKNGVCSRARRTSLLKRICKTR